MVDLNKLKDLEDQAYVTNRDVIIPAGTVIQNWSDQQKADGNRFEMTIGFHKDAAFFMKFTPSDLKELIVCDPDFLTEVDPDSV